MRHLICALAIGLVASPERLGATQAKPDFSGTWRMDESRSVSATHDGYVSPTVWRIQQDERAMVVDIAHGLKTFNITFRLLAKPPASTPEGRFPIYIGYWNGDRLVTETAQNISGQTVTTVETRLLQAGGREMHVERIVRVEHGYSLRGGQNYNSARDVFVRVEP